MRQNDIGTLVAVAPLKAMDHTPSRTKSASQSRGPEPPSVNARIKAQIIGMGQTSVELCVPLPLPRRVAARLTMADIPCRRISRFPKWIVNRMPVLYRLPDFPDVDH